MRESRRRFGRNRFDPAKRPPPKPRDEFGNRIFTAPDVVRRRNAGYPDDPEAALRLININAEFHQRRRSPR